jgi:cyclophilin family peptidyl-prolyl cis-trans isomerase/HEAT repeat protein
MASATRRHSPVSLVSGILLAALAAGCASAPPPPPPAIEEAAAVSRSPDLESRALLLLMSDRRLYDPVALQLMLSGTPEVRRSLAVALGRIGDRRGRSLLQGLLVDSSIEVRRSAAFALGQLGDPAAERALIAAAVDDDEELGSLAVEALGKLKRPLADVRRALSALDPGAAWRRLAPFLFRFHDPAMTDAAREGLASDDPEVRAGCAYALGRQPKPEAADALRGLLADPDPRIRAWAARGLGEVGGLDDLARLAPLVDGSQASPAIQALRSAGRILGRASALPPLAWADRIRRVIADPRPPLRATALEVAGRFLPNPDLEAELRATLDHGEPHERELALTALALGRVDGAGDLVAAAASEGTPGMRATAASAAASLGRDDLLTRLGTDAEPRVRVAALDGRARAVETAGGDAVAADVAAAAEQFLDDPDPTVRATALDLLARYPEAPSERLAAVLDASRKDAMDDARLAGVRALAARGKAAPAEREPVVEALRRLGSDTDWLVRREAADGLAGLGEQRPAVGALDLGRTTDYYRDVLEQTASPRRVVVETERGAMTLELDCPRAPLTCLSFLKLAEQGFFDGLTFHRVVPDFVVQGGDPRGDGWGGPGYALRDEINRLRYERGTLGMALSGPDTGGSQFFIALSRQPHLDGGYTAFGRVVDGDAVLDQIRQGDRIEKIREVPAGPGAAAAAAGVR